MRVPKLFGGADPITTLERQRERFSAELKAAVAEESAAVESRRVMLVTPDSTDAQLKAAASRVRKAKHEREIVEEAMRAVATELEDAYRARAGEQERAERERLAAETNARADRIAAVARELDVAGRAFAKAREKLEDIVCADGLVPELWGGGPLSGPIVYHATRITTPGLVDMDRQRAALMGGTFLVGAVEASEAFHIAPLREAARAIRAGEAPAVAPKSPLPRRPTVVIEDTQIVLSEGVQWNGVNGMPVVASEGGCTLPIPVAEAAIAAGIGHAPDSPEAQAILRELQRGEPTATGVPRGPNAPPPIVRRGPPYRILPVSLYAIIEAERARLAQSAA